MRRTIAFFSAVLLATTALAGPLAAQRASSATPSTQLSLETKKGLEQSLDKGLAFLRTQQKPNGSWEFHEGMTGLVLIAFYKSPTRSPKDEPMLEKGLKFLTTLAKPDGSIFSKDMPNANTALAIMAMQASGKPEYKSYIQKGQ